MAHHRQTQEVTVRNTRLTHRWMLAFVLACLALAAVAVSAPAATPQDLRSPDARAIAQERYYSSDGDPVQDLRSPDARDAGSPVVAAAPAPVAEPGGRDGIAPLPFVLALAGAIIVGVGLSTAVHARRRVPA